MKKFLGALFAIMPAAAYGFDGQIATVACDLTERQSPDVERLEIVSTRSFTGAQAPVRDGLHVEYRDGTEEFLEPAAGTDPFGDPAYTTEVPFKTGLAFFPASRVGDIRLRMVCHYAPGIPWDRCQSQGSGEHGPLSAVTLNIGGDVVRFVGQNLCPRTVSEF